MQRSSEIYDPSQHRRFRRVAMSFFTLIIATGLQAFSATNVQASCGDYLTHHSAGDRNLMSLPEHSNPLSDASHQTPCHGPLCRQGPIQLPLSAPVITLEPQDRWGWMANVAMQSVDQIHRLALSNESFAPLQVAFRLDRPPKV